MFIKLDVLVNIKENIKGRVTSPLWEEFPHKGCSAENVSIWWRHNVDSTRAADYVTPCWNISLYCCSETFIITFRGHPKSHHYVGTNRHQVLLTYNVIIQLLLPRNVMNTLRPEQNIRHCADNTFKCMFMMDFFSIQIVLSCTPNVQWK